MNLDNSLQDALRERRAKSLYRQRTCVESAQGVEIVRNGKSYLSFCSNDYLGLANHPKVIEAFNLAAKKYGVGSGASHLVCGHSHEHHALEEALADFTGRSRALLFSSGYMANMGVINALLKRGDTVFEDRLNHASLIDGALLSAADFKRFRHNDLAHLEQQLSQSNSIRKVIVVDGVFSMDGDFAKLPDLCVLAEKYNAWLVVDDAHGFGCVGKNGNGSVEHFGLGHSDVPILIGTLGKAFGTFGAFVAGSATLIETLIQFARTYIYTTALPPAVAAATRVSLGIIKQEPQRREHLTSLIDFFRQGCRDLKLDIMVSTTPIQPVLVGSADKAMKISHLLESKGFWVSAIRPPTVPADTARLRVTFSANHTIEHVASLLNALAEAFNAVE
ncbi:8-amino-7-oxononanoate synthase [Agarilytica rhodophyticola]|uniref:8-amino-7-oxononanoate synthase n=1 Tax=Agarilytica rhodophyticola TaxID=1737490 RepID=UPI000B348237|nr:8-amino-7-oxononanoate synthase [Agarilytica rhodophyticola]